MGKFKKINEEIEAQKERDWYFARALSQLGNYNNKKIKILFVDIETHAWRKGAGWAYRYDEEKEFFCEKLGLEEKEYKYMRQMICLQHLISSNSDNSYTYEAVEKAIFEHINAKDVNGDKKETIEDLKDNSTYKDTYEFLSRLKKYERNQGK